jgi:mRNA interferase MazF
MIRGEIYWADLVPRSGAEQTGRRPVIVVSHDGFNRTPGWKSIIVVPVSTSASQGKRGPTVVELPGGSTGLPKASFALCHQVTTLDRAKLARKIGTLSGEALGTVGEALKASMDLD